MKKCLAPFVMITMSAGALASTSVTGHVKDLSIQKDLGSFVFVLLDAPQTAPIACQSNPTWTYTFPQATTTDKQILAMLMLAKATGQTVTLQGSGACSDFPGIESAIRIDTQQ